MNFKLIERPACQLVGNPYRLSTTSVGVAFVASLIPALHATHIDTFTVIRDK